MQVQELMTRDVRTCRPDEDLNAAARVMWENDCGVVPVVTGGGRLAGMITDRDICMAAYTRGRCLSDLRVSDAMSTQVHSCRPTDDVADAASLMQMHQVRRLPVVDGDRVVGVLSSADLLVTTARQPDGDGLGIDAEQVALVLAAVSYPRSARSQTPVHGELMPQSRGALPSAPGGKRSSGNRARSSKSTPPPGSAVQHSPTADTRASDLPPRM